MATIEDFTNPLRCFCGKATTIYDGLFERNFCSMECATNLRNFLGGLDKSIKVKRKIEAGDFIIQGAAVLLKHQISKAASIDKIDAQITADLEKDKQRRELKKIGLADEVIEQMLSAKG